MAFWKEPSIKVREASCEAHSFICFTFLGASFMFVLVFWNEGQTSRMVKPVEKERYKEHEGDSDPEKERYKEREKSEKVLAFNSKEGANHEVAAFPSKEKYDLCKPISELDLSNCQRCTPSYRLLPENVS